MFIAYSIVDRVDANNVSGFRLLKDKSSIYTALAAKTKRLPLSIIFMPPRVVGRELER